MSRKFIPVILGLILYTQNTFAQDCVIEFGVTSVTVCFGDSAFVLPTPDPAIGEYSGIHVNDDGTFNSVSSGIGTFSVDYSVNVPACIGTATLPVIVVPVDSGLSISGDISICEGDSTTLSAPQGVEYTWMTGVKTNSYTFFPDSTTTYYVVGPSPNGCSVTQELTITVNDRNDAAAIVGPTSACYGEYTSFEIVGTDDFAWAGGSTDQIIDVYLTSDTTLMATFGENPECDTTLSISVEVADQISFSWSVPTSLCQGETFTIVILDGNASFFKFQGENFTDSVDVYIPDDDTVVIQAFNDIGCYYEQNIYLQVNDVPEVQVYGPQNGCIDENIVLYADGALDYVWTDLETGQEINTFLPSQHLFLSHNPDTMHFRVEGFSEYNCSSSDDFTIAIYPFPQLTVDSLTAFCEDRQATLVASGADYYEWNDVPGDSINSFFVNADSTFYVKAYNVPECPVLDTLVFMMHPNPVMQLLGENFICELDTATLIASGIDYVLWNGELGYGVYGATPVYDSLITAIGYNMFGCTDTAQIFIEVDPAPVVTFTGDGDICVGDSGYLEVTTDGVSFQWADGSLDYIIPVHPADDTTYVVTALAANGCDRTAVFNVIVNDYPVIGFEGNTTACFGDPLSFTANGADSYTWSNGLSGESIEYVPFSTSILRLYGNTNDCITQLPISITVHERPVVHFEFSADTLCESSTGVSWVSSPFGGQLSGDGIVNNWFELSAAQQGLNTVTYSFTNEFNCTASESDILVVEQCIGMNEESEMAIEIYPNPFTEALYLQSVAGFADATVRSVNGTLLWSGKIQGRMNVETRTWAPGVYLIELQSGSTSITKRVVKM